jgi:uncharacterized membrane protein YecN with MAPEG domain
MKPWPLRARKRADLLSVTGAALAGVGAGVWLVRWIGDVAGVAFGVGLVAHAIGMAARHRLDTREAGPLPAAWRALYTACWLGIAGVVAYGLWRWFYAGGRA